MPAEKPLLSVILAAHGGTKERYVAQCLSALQRQSYPAEHMEVVLLLDDAPDLYTLATESFDDMDTLSVLYRDNGRGLAEARNYAARCATGDIYAFLDIDTIPSDHWADALVTPFESHGAHVVGGPATANWPDDSRPFWFPEEMDWLVGVTDSGITLTDELPSEPEPIRNPYGCNFAVKADTFDTLGGFNPVLGKADSPLQGEETELCIRVHEQSSHPDPVWIAPRATVRHFVDREQTQPATMLERAYYQGVTKAIIEDLHPGTVSDQEAGYLGHLLRSSVRKLPNLWNLAVPVRLVMLWALVAAVGSGYTKTKLSE